jgi:hypothetical protein
MLIIRADLQGEILAKHPICHGKGELIKNRQQTRDSSKAEAILDRIVHDTYQFLLDGEISMRERHGLSKKV